MFCGPSNILKNISWAINACQNYFMTPTKALHQKSNRNVDELYTHQNSALVFHLRVPSEAPTLGSHLRIAP